MDATGEYWTGLLAFVRSAEHGSFTAASRQLGLTPSSVGRAVTRLEQRLGVKLMKRATRALSLTAEGRQFLEHVAPALDLIADAEETVGAGRPARGTVRVSASIDLGRTLVAEWSADLAREYPGLTIELNVTDRLVDLRREGIDVAIRLGSLPPLGVTGEQIGTLGYAVVAAPSYLAENKAPRTPADLDEHRCLQYLTIEGAPLRWTFEGHEIATTGPFLTDDGGALLSAVLGGTGIAYMLRFAVHAALLEGTLIEVLPDVPKAELPVSLSHPFGARPPARVRTVLEFLRNRILRVG